MFEPAPDFNADDKGCAIAAKQFYERVLHYAYQYNVFSEHRIGVINNCCSYLENLHRDNKQKYGRTAVGSPWRSSRMCSSC